MIIKDLISMKKIFDVFVVFLLVLSFIIFDRCDGTADNSPQSTAQVSLFDSSASLNWTMINVGPGDAHLIQIKGGKTILIDTGLISKARKKIIPYLRAIPIDNIDYVFISHAHSDHYEGLSALISSNISIGAVYFNIPSDERCKAEPWGCNPQDIANIVKLLEGADVPLNKAEAGTTFALDDDSNLDILYAFNLNNSPVGYIDLNDESLIMLLRHKKHRLLFTGDLNSRIGTFLTERGDNLQADVIKLPHHGTAGISPNSFFDKVNPQYAMVPSASGLWCSYRSLQCRNWLKEKNIPAYVSGFHGDVNLSVINDNLTFTTQQNFRTTDFCNETNY